MGSQTTATINTLWGSSFQIEGVNNAALNIRLKVSILLLVIEKHSQSNSAKVPEG